jgi:hypothetical protein
MQGSRQRAESQTGERKGRSIGHQEEESRPRKEKEDSENYSCRKQEATAIEREDQG